MWQELRKCIVFPWQLEGMDRIVKKTIVYELIQVQNINRKY